MSNKILVLISVLIFLLCAEISSSETHPVHRQTQKNISITNSSCKNFTGKKKHYSLLPYSYYKNPIHKFSGKGNSGRYSEKIIVFSGPCHSYGFMYEYEEFPDFA